MDLLAQRGIAAHYSGRILVPGLVGHALSNRTSRGKTVCLNDANIALRVSYLFPLPNSDHQNLSQNCPAMRNHELRLTVHIEPIDMGSAYLY